MEILTDKQAAVLEFIETYQMEHGKSPTIKEMREHFGVSSDNSILKHLRALVDKGYIEKDDTPRGISLLSRVKQKLASSEIRLPVLGFIPAGGPVLTEEYIQEWRSVGEEMVRHPENAFLLQVTGDSMEEAGIYEGDLLVVDAQLEPKLEDIVVALVDNQNTVKRYMKDKKGRAYLKPENKKYGNIYPEADLQMQGVVTSLIRQYK